MSAAGRVFSAFQARLRDTEMLAEVAKWAWSNVYDGPGSEDAAWVAVALEIEKWLISGEEPWKRR